MWLSHIFRIVVAAVCSARSRASRSLATRFLARWRRAKACILALALKIAILFLRSDLRLATSWRPPRPRQTLWICVAAPWRACSLSYTTFSSDSWCRHIQVRMAARTSWAPLCTSSRRASTVTLAMRARATRWILTAASTACFRFFRVRKPMPWRWMITAALCRRKAIRTKKPRRCRWMATVALTFFRRRTAKARQMACSLMAALCSNFAWSRFCALCL
mmetsp:Transcript_79220/g.190114  ORF Transcript_79220/g.190114 Transcript_79220/m.190114 type:complete len:219 (+) Transcript_79220:278-934(+)